MIFEIYHCFYFGEKRKIRKEGIRIRKVFGKEMTYQIFVPNDMLHAQKDPFGGEMYSIRRDGYFLGTIIPYRKSFSWLPGDNIGKLF